MKLVGQECQQPEWFQCEGPVGVGADDDNELTGPHVGGSNAAGSPSERGAASAPAGFRARGSRVRRHVAAASADPTPER